MEDLCWWIIVGSCLTPGVNGSEVLGAEAVVHFLKSGIYFLKGLRRPSLHLELSVFSALIVCSTDISNRLTAVYQFYNCLKRKKIETDIS